MSEVESAAQEMPSTWWTRRRFIATSLAAGAVTVMPVNLVRSASALVTSTPAGNWLWLQTNVPQTMDDQLLQFITTHYSGMVYNAPRSGPVSRFDYSEVVQRIKTIQPSFPVLMYTYGAATNPRNRNNHWWVLEDYQNLCELLVPEFDQGAVFGSPPGASSRYWGDPRQQGFRDWLVERLSEGVDTTGTDGVAIDITAVRPNLWQQLTQQELDDYKNGMYDLFDELRAELGPERLVLFNPLAHDRDGCAANPEFESQVLLIPHASGAAIEHFGYDPGTQCRSDILPFLPLPQQHPDRVLLFHGRGQHLVYESYGDDYLRQRYDYAGYLLAAGDHAYFNYLGNGAHPAVAGSAGTPGPRTSTVDVFADWAVELGAPLGAYQDVGGLLVREFSGGVVALNPEPEPPQTGSPLTFEFSGDLYDPEGHRFQDEVVIDPARAVILLASPPAATPGTVAVFGGAQGVGQDWNFASNQTDHLHLDATPPGDEWEHDVLLDLVRSLQPPDRLTAKIRTSDPNARLELVAEVDDSSQTSLRVVLVVSTIAAAPGTPSTPGPNSLPRVSIQQARAWFKNDDWPTFPTNVAIQSDGQWHTVDLDVAAVLAAAGGQYTPRRLSHVRLIGAMDVEQISTQLVLLHEDFTAGDDSEWEKFNGTWTVSGGVYHQTQATGAPRSIYTVGLGWTDYVYSADVKRANHEGIMFRVNDEQNFYLFHFRPAINAVTLSRLIDNVFVQLENIPVDPLTVGQFYNLKVVASDDTFELFLEETKVGEVVDATFPSGTVGLRTANTATDFDNVRVLTSMP